MSGSQLLRRAGDNNNYPLTVPGLGFWVDSRRPYDVGCWLPGATGHCVSTPDSAAVSVTGDMDIRVKCALVDWTPVAYQMLLSKFGAAGHKSFAFYVTISGSVGKFVLETSSDGTATTAAVSTNANVIPDGISKWVRATRVASTGIVQFFTSDDGSSWTQLGSNSSNTAGNIFDSDAVLEVGSSAAGTANYSTGLFSRAQVYNGIAGTLVFDANFVSKGDTFIESSSNAATVTCNSKVSLANADPMCLWADLSGNGRNVVQATSIKQPLWHATGVTFDGSNDLLQAGAWSQSQPTTVYAVGAWNTGSNGYMLDLGSGVGDKQVIHQNTSAIKMYAGGNLTISATTNTNFHVMAAIFNGTSSFGSYDGTAISPGTGGANAIFGVTLGGGAAGNANWGAVSIASVLVYAGAHDTATRKRTEKWLGRQFNITVVP